MAIWLTIDMRAEDNGAKRRGDVIKATLPGAPVGTKEAAEFTRIEVSGVEFASIEARLQQIALTGEKAPMIIYPFRVGEHPTDLAKCRSTYNYDPANITDAMCAAAGITKAQALDRKTATPVIKTADCKAMSADALTFDDTDRG